LEIHSVLPVTRTALTMCHEMPAAIRANLIDSERQLPIAEQKLLEAHDAEREWTEQLGKLEIERRREQVRYWRDQVHRHKSDRRHWLVQAQAWRDCLAIHPELVDVAAGSKCSHGYSTPMCVVVEPELKRARDRVPGEDDE